MKIPGSQVHGSADFRQNPPGMRFLDSGWFDGHDFRDVVGVEGGGLLFGVRSSGMAGRATMLSKAGHQPDHGGFLFDSLPLFVRNA